MKTFFSLIGGALVLVIYSCSLNKSTVVYFKTNKEKIYQGDTLKVHWEVKNSKNVRSITWDGSNKNLSLKGDTLLILHKDTTLILLVNRENNLRPIKKTHKIEVIKPEIILFAAFRTRSCPPKVVFSWEVRGVEQVAIEGYKYNLPPKGTDTLEISQSTCFNLIAKSLFTTMTKTCYVEDLPTVYPFIKKDTAIFQLPEHHKITFKILETDVNNFPKEIKLKIIVYDSLGNFITHLAPPYSDTATTNKYFRKIIEKTDISIRENKFGVKEVHESLELYDIALTLDYSGSMTKNINLLEHAVTDFIKAKYPEDRISVVKFDHRLAEYCKLDNNEVNIISSGNFCGIDTLGGSTALYASIDKGLKTFDNSKNKKMVMLFTDGFENSSLMYQGDYAATINEVVCAIRTKKSSLMIVGLGYVNIPLLNELANYSNGSFYYISSPDDIFDVYKEIRHNQRTYYEVTIKPCDTNGEHVIQLTYFNNQNITITERPFFTGNNIDLTKFEIDTTAYWYRRDLIDKKYRITIAPQVLVNFNFDQDSITNTYIIPLLKIVKYLNNNLNTMAIIYGHTDKRGDDNYNLDLSQRRVLAVYQFLVYNGINPSRIEYLGLGEKHPVWTIDNEEWAAKENRRVEIVIWENVK